MTNVTPKTREELPEMEPLWQMVEAGMGFVPESMFTMAHWPELLQTFGGIAGTVLNSGEVDAGLKQLIAYVVSNAAGCKYCQAHTSHNATNRGVDAEKVRSAFEFETSELFDEAETAALRLALHAGMVPNATEPVHFRQLKEHYSDRQIVEIVAVISLFGFLNRWNDTMATTLESGPRTFAGENLSGWEVGKHG
jgi:AhpD family alkylhydroperoxidase